MGTLLSLILPALVPAMADGVRALIGKLTGGFKPLTIDEQIRLMVAENEKLKALAELDKPAENISRWVADLRASFRYLAAGIIILAAVGSLYTKTTLPEVATENLWYMAGSVFSFLFGDRMYMYLRKGGK